MGGRVGADTGRVSAARAAAALLCLGVACLLAFALATAVSLDLVVLAQQDVVIDRF
jgi:hypothetical protein